MSSPDSLPSALPTVLVVDDEDENRELCRRILDRQFNILEASNGEDALELARTHDVAAVVTDQRMPKMTGTDMLARMQKFKRDVPKIIVTAFGDVDPVIMAVNSCALFGYLIKPIRQDELRSLVNRAVKQYLETRLVKDMVQRLEEEKVELQLDNEQLQRTTAQISESYNEMAKSLKAMGDAYREMCDYANRDGLTQLLNRRTFAVQLQSEFSRWIRYKRMASLLVVDVDNFKSINDRHGHPIGDKVLCAISAIITKGIRVNDLAFRIGGDEFAIILAEANQQAAESVVAKLNAETRACSIIGEGEVEVSTGRCTLAEQVRSGEDWYALADRDLYQSKRQKKGAS